MKKPEGLRKRPQLGPLEALETRALLTIAATAPLPDVSAAAGATVATVNLDSYFKDPAASPDFAIFDTTLGTIPVLLTPSSTPATVANFDSYVAKGAYTNVVVQRSIPGFIWQAGGYDLDSSGKIAEIPADSPVKNEFGASNLRGTIALAKVGNDPNSGTNEFFFNESDSNAANLDNQNGGFTVFGHIIGTAGLAVMDAIGNVTVPSPSPFPSPLDQIPLQNYTSGTIQPSNLVVIKNVSETSELFLASSDTPGVATASAAANSLTINPIAPGTAHITVVAYGSDGMTATESFAVDVSSASQPVTTTPVTQPVTAQPVATTPIIATPVATPTPVAPVTTPINPPVATPPSVLTPTASGTLPTSAVPGGKTKIQQTVFLFDPSSTIAQKERVNLELSPDSTGLSGEVTIASTTTKVKLKPGKLAKLTLSTRQLGASVPAGTYHVLVSVTDPDGGATTVDTGRTLIVQAHQPKSVKK